MIELKPRWVTIIRSSTAMIELKPRWVTIIRSSTAMIELKRAPLDAEVQLTRWAIRIQEAGQDVLIGLLPLLSSDPLQSLGIPKTPPISSYSLPQLLHLTIMSEPLPSSFITDAPSAGGSDLAPTGVQIIPVTTCAICSSPEGRRSHRLQSSACRPARRSHFPLSLSSGLLLRLRQVRPRRVGDAIRAEPPPAPVPRAGHGTLHRVP
jgi:hypothetical protein